MTHCQVSIDTGEGYHDGDERCAHPACRRQSVYCTDYTALSLTSPHACRCETPAHGYFCQSHQRGHALTHRAPVGLARPDTFPGCGSQQAMRALLSICGAQGLNYESESSDEDVELVEALTADGDDFLNYSDPGTNALRDALKSLARRLGEDESSQIAREGSKTGEGDSPYLHFSAYFWSGGTRDIVAAHAAYHLTAARARREPPWWDLLPPFVLSRTGGLAVKDSEDVRSFVHAAFVHARSVAERIAGVTGHTWEQQQRLFELVDEVKHAERVASWLGSVAAQPLSTPDELVRRLILEWEPQQSFAVL
jgi:hypothetical protein